MKVYVVHERDYYRYPIIGIYATREAAEMVMMEEGWHRDGHAKTYCDAWELDGQPCGDEGFEIGERHYVGSVRRGRIPVAQGGIHRIPIDCLYYRHPGQSFVNAGLIIVGDEGPAKPQAGVNLMDALEQVTIGGPLPSIAFDSCCCSQYLIVEGPTEAWNEYKTSGWNGPRDDPEWIDPA